MPIIPPLVEPEDEVLENGEEEEQFLSAIHKGDINTFMDMLNRKEEIYLNLECKDANGKSALRIAIAEGYSGRLTIMYLLIIHLYLSTVVCLFCVLLAS